jgi:hypothetical protein
MRQSNLRILHISTSTHFTWIHEDQRFLEHNKTSFLCDIDIHNV